MKRFIFIKMDDAPCMVNAFQKEFSNVEFFSTQKDNTKKIYSCLDTLDNEDKVFIQTHNRSLFSNIQVFDNLLKRKVKVIHWTGDVRDERDSIWYDDVGKHVFMTCFSNMTDVIRCKQKGVTSEYFQIGFDPLAYKKINTINANEDIVFMGSDYGNRFPLSEERRNIVKTLKYCYGKKFGVFGHSWENHGISSRFINEKEENILYNNAKIAVNFSHYLRPRYTSDRIFRAMGAGCMVLSQNYPDIELEFTPGKHLEVFNDVHQLVEKINYYLLNEEKRTKIAQDGYTHVHSEHTWEKRAVELRSLYDKFNF